MLDLRIAAASASIALAAAVSGCEGGSDPADRALAIVTDSAGVTIVESRAPEWGLDERWRVGEEPLVRIGAEGEEPPVHFHEIQSAFRLSGGDIVVLQSVVPFLRSFTPSGSVRWSAEAAGSGPGDLSLPATAGPLAEDTIQGLDLRQFRVSRFDDGGRYLGGERLGNELFPISNPVLLPDGRILFTRSPPFDWSRQGVFRDPMTLITATLDSRQADTLETFPGGETFVISFVESERRFFGRNTRYAVGGDPARVAVGDNEHAAFQVYDPDGTLLQVVRWEQAPLEVRSDDVDYHGGRLREFAGARGLVQEYERVIAAMPVPGTMPAFASLHADTEGRVWVETYRRPTDDVPRYRVFGTDGRWLTHVSLPVGMQPLEIGPDYVLGLETDEYNHETIALYALVTP